MTDGMEQAKAFGALLRDHPKAAAYYDNCAPEQKQALLLKLSSVEDMPSFVERLSRLPQ